MRCVKKGWKGLIHSGSLIRNFELTNGDGLDSECVLCLICVSDCTVCKGCSLCLHSGLLLMGYVGVFHYDRPDLVQVVPYELQASVIC